jgi:4-oxalocrotonate tautomerase
MGYRPRYAAGSDAEGSKYHRSHIVLQGITMPVVILKMRKGWTTEQKRKIVKEFTNTLVSTLKIDPDLVTIMIDEHSLEDIGHGGVLRCDEH